MKLKRFNENFEWDFDEDETPDGYNPYSLNFPSYLLVNDNLKGYIKLNTWPNRMYDLIGKEVEIIRISEFNYRNLNNKPIKKDAYYIKEPDYWFIPFDCMDKI